MAITMMIHAEMHQPEGVITSDMRPQALDHAVWIYNRMPQPSHSFIPLKLLTRSNYLPVEDIIGFSCNKSSLNLF